MKGEFRVRIADVARKAHVSEATVSRALNNPEIVSPELLKRVNEAIRALKYRPNPHAKSLAGLTSPSVGILLFNEVGEVFRSPFWAQAISSLYPSLLSRDFQCSLIFQPKNLFGQNQKISKASFLRFLRTRHVDAFIVLGFPPLETLEAFEECNIPILMWGRPLSLNSNIAYVETDNLHGAADAVNYLIDKERTQIALISARSDSTGSTDRTQGYLMTLEKRGLPADEQLIVHGDYSLESGRSAMRTLLKRSVDFDSIFAINDSMAFGALEVLADLKIKVPKQVAIVGFDGVQSENRFSQDLTTVCIDIQAICNLIVDKIGKVLNGKSVKSELVPALLLARETA